nr:ABC transporter permease [Haloarchaeobius amylolyticus]
MAVFPVLPGVTAPPATLGRVSGALFAAAFLAGVVGLFQVISARRADGRLALAGFSRRGLLAGRLLTVAGVGVAGATVSLAALWYGVEPEQPLLAFGALVLAGLSYGLLGVLVGSVLPRELEGSLVLVFAADVDAALSSGLVEGVESVARFLPLHHVHAVFEAAVLDSSVPTADAGLALAYTAVLAVLATIAYARLTRGGAA